MKKSVTVIAGVLLFALGAAATDVPRYETELGYMYVRANQVNNNGGLGQQIGGFDMNGGSGQFIYNYNHWLSGVADVGAATKPNVGIVHVEDTTVLFVFGPRVSYHWKRCTPYGQVLFGGADQLVSRRVYAVTDLNTPVLPVVTPANLFPGPGQPVIARISSSQAAFAMTAGGGIDLKMNKHVSFRPVAVDYLLTRFPSLTTGKNYNQNSLRATAGFVFTFGAM
jgi:hypothetical protein